MFSAPPKIADDADSEGVDPAEVQNYFVKHGRYTAGTATRYTPVDHLGRADASGSRQRPRRSACAFIPRPSSGWRTPSRFSLGHTVKADGRWRLFAFADGGDPAARDLAHAAHCATFLPTSAESPIRKYTPASADIDSVIDVRAIFQQGHRELAIEAMPSLLLPAKGRYGLRDYEKMFCPDLKGRQRHFRHARHRSRQRLHGRRPTRPVCRPRPPARRLRGPCSLLRRLHEAKRVSLSDRRHTQIADPHYLEMDDRMIAGRLRTGRFEPQHPAIPASNATSATAIRPARLTVRDDADADLHISGPTCDP